MDEEVINDLYNRAKSKGYQKSLEEFVSLLHSDQEVFNDMYGYVQSKGYKKGTEGFSALIGKTQQQPTQQQPAQQQTTKIQSLTQQTPAKKKEPTVSSSEGGWSGWLGSAIKDVKETYEAAKAPKKEPLLNEEESEEAWKKKVKREPENFDFGMSKYFPDIDKPGAGVLLSEKKYPLSFLGRRSQEQIEDEVPEFIKPVVEKIDNNLLRQGKDIAKKELDYYLEDAGFKVSYEENTISDIILGISEDSPKNAITITAPDGEVRRFKVMTDDVTEADKIKQFVKEKSNLISEKDYLYKNENRKFRSKEEIDNEVKNISNQENLMNDEYKKYLWMEKDIKYIQSELKKYKDFGEENTPKYIQTSAYLKQLQDEYQALGEKVKNKAGTLIEQQKQLEKAAGKYLELQSEKGSFSGALYRGFMDSAANIYSQYVRMTFSGMASIMPGSTIYSQEQFDNAYRKRLFDEGIIKRMDEPLDGVVMDKAKQAEISSQVDAELRDKFKKAGITGYYEGEKLNNVTTVNSIRENLSEFLNMPTSTTKEYKEKLEKDGSFITRGLLGLSGSIPAMLGGPAIRITNMFMMTTDAVMREMDNDPDFANISENEKALVALPIGVVGAALEEFGFRNLVKGSSVTSNILKTVLGRVPSNASASLLRKTTLDVIAEMGIRGTTALAGAALSEAETGALQQANEYLVKDSYNMLKGKKMFDNPEFLSSQYFYDIYDASRTEMVGGFVMGVPYSAAAAFQKDGFQALDDTTFKIFEELTKDGDSRKFFVTSLKNKINQGEITAKQSQQMLDAYDQASGMIGRVPDEITDTKARKIAMDLISERKKLEGKREKYDDALAKPIQDKIDNINKQLTQLTEDAIQKQTTGEVSVQPEAGAGQEVEVGGPEAKPKITPEESKRKEDLVAAFEDPKETEVLEDGKPFVYIKVGEYYTNKEMAQAELDAIITKEQAAVTEQGGMEQAEGLGTQLETVAKEEQTPAKVTTTTEVLTDTPTETKASVTFIAPDGNEVALEGNEQVAAQLYDEAVAVAEEQRTPEQNDIIQKMQPIVAAAAPAAEVTPAEVTTTEVTPAEQFTEQDRARKAELEEAMRKADKRRKNITVGETTMPKAEAKAELDALNQKEQAAQQPVTPAVEVAPTEVAPTEVAPTETRTAEQEADLLEELLTGKKKEPVVTETVTEAAPVVEEGVQVKEEVSIQPEIAPIADKKADIEKRIIITGTDGGFEIIDSSNDKNEQSGTLNDVRRRQSDEKFEIDYGVGDNKNSLFSDMKFNDNNSYHFFVTDKKTNKRYYVVGISNRVIGNDPGRNGSLFASIEDNGNITEFDRTLLELSLIEAFNKQVKKRPNIFEALPQEFIDKVNAKYDAELAKSKPAAEVKVEPTSKEAKGKKSKFIDEKGRVNVEEILKTLSDKFSIPFEIINDPDQNYSGKFEDGRVYVNLAYVTAETPWHEFAHPFIEQVKADNPKLYSSLVNEINTSTYGKQVLAEVKELYPELSEEGQIEEAIVETIARLVTGKVSKTELKENKTFFQKVLDFVQSIKDALAKMLGVYSVNIADLNNNFTLKHIAEIMQYGGRINLKEYSPIINKNKSKEVRYYINGNRLVGEQKSIADEFSNLVDYIKKPNNDRLLQFSSFLKLKYLLEKDLSFLPKEIIEKYKKIIDDVLVIFPNKNKERTKENLKAEKIFYKSKLDEIILLYPKLQIEKKSKDLPSIQFKNQWTVKDFKSAYHNIGAYMNNAGISSINDAINNFINLLSTGSRIEVAAYSSESALETIGGTIRLKFKQETPVIRSYLTDVKSNLIDKNGKLERITEKGNLKLRTDIDEEIETYMFSSYDELFINATKNNIKDIELLKDISPEELGKLKELSELTGAPIIQNNQTIYEPSTKREYKPESVKYSKFTPSSIADAIVKNLTIKAGGLQSNILGIPIAIWNSGVKTMAAAVRAGAAINEAVQKAIEHIREKHGKKFNEAAAEKKLLIGQYKGAIEVAREAKVTDEGLKAYFKRQGLTDAQIEALLTFKEKAEKKPISKEKVIGKPKPKKVTVNEMTALKDQLRLEAKAAREAKGDLNAKRKMLAAAIKEMEKKGSITARQAKALINRVNAVNLDNPVMVERLLDYAEKVFNDAAYAEKLSQAKKLQSTAKSLSKNKEKNPEVRELAKKFAEIDPALVENIDEYIEMASAVVEGVKGSKLTAKGVSLAAAVDINETSKYIEKALEQQAEKQKQMMADKMQSLMGVDVSDLTYDQLLELLDDSSKPIDKYKETIIRDIINKMFDTYSGIIESMLETGKDPFDISEDAETIEFKDSTKQVVRNFMSIDLNSLSPREALKAVDALNNFIVNGSTANMETVYNTYLANENASTVRKKGVKGKKLTFFFVPSLGRILLDEFASLPLLLESMFKSTNVALYFSRMSGLSNLMNGAARATTITQKTIARYLDAFSKLKPNGKAFNDAYNATERGMVAFMSRNLIGSEAKMKKEFNDRKSLVEKSIEELSKGTAKEQEKAKLYQEAYDKILKDSKNAQQVRDKAAKENVEAVDWWINEWSKHIDELSDVSLNVYNKILERELNYTTDRMSRLELATKDESVLDSNGSAYHFNNGTMYKKEAGALKETVDKTGELPKNKDGEVTRYVDLSFDSIQASSLYDAMADIKTAGAIRQVEAFFKSDDTRSLFSAEDFKLLRERVNLSIRNIRNQQSYDNGEIEKLVKALDKFAKYSASIALAGVTQPFKQTIPLMFNTLINAGQFDPFGVTFNKDIKNFIDESGRAIANRGVESQVYIESINRLIDEAAKSKGEAALKLIEQANDLWMKVFLANPDRYIARAAWMAYYEQSLKKQGINTKGIDYASHELNDEAADYAQMMVDRQQNITDTKLAGRMYSDTKGGWGKKVLTRMLLPLASFRLNQFIRAKSDTATLFSKTTTLQDKTKAARSLSGMAAEMLVFKSMVIGFGLTWHYISDAILAAITGDEEDEEESEKKWKVRFNNLVKGQATSTVTDLFSPIPILDPFVKYGANTALDVTQDFLKVADDDKFKLFVDDLKSPKTYASSAGMYGIGLDKINEIFKTSNLAITGKFIDDRGYERFIRDEQRSLLSWLLIPSVVFNAGLLPGAPEFNNITGKITKDIKYSGMTEKQMDVYKKTGLDKDEIKRSKEKAFKGYSSEKQFEENDPEGYAKAIEEGTIYDYKKQQQDIRIATGEMTPEQLYKVNPKLWKEKYGPGTDYYRQQRTPAARKKAREEQRYKAEIKAKKEVIEAKRQREEARKKRRY